MLHHIFREQLSPRNILLNDLNMSIHPRLVDNYFQSLNAPAVHKWFLRCFILFYNRKASYKMRNAKFTYRLPSLEIYIWIRISFNHFILSNWVGTAYAELIEFHCFHEWKLPNIVLRWNQSKNHSNKCALSSREQLVNDSLTTCFRLLRNTKWKSHLTAVFGHEE